jgi:hypothetical protein
MGRVRLRRVDWRMITYVLAVRTPWEGWKEWQDMVW